jgi:protein-tyrosine phosphatase
MPRRIKVLFVCLGNICRSPMAEGVFCHRAKLRGRLQDFEVDSAGTAAYHAGELADRRTRGLLEAHGIEMDSRARQVEGEDFEHYDYVFAMDSSNYRDLVRRCPAGHQQKLKMVLEPIGGGDVPDPYYGGPDGFELNFRQLSEAIDHWLDRLL